ncbi:hypothetical protein C8R44DRAFT_984272 [Mycena epipterygia]|nr:hypothetical protein C8R44DRAFT_984272 [Mycena epipterygia]
MEYRGPSTEDAAMHPKYGVFGSQDEVGIWEPKILHAFRPLASRSDEGQILAMLSLLWLFILAPALLSAASEPYWYKRNKATVKKIYDLTIFPANAKIIAEGVSAVPADLFNANATGRVTPDSIEYFFGLAPLPTGVPPNGAFTNATLVEFVSGCPDVAASTVYLTASTINADNSTGPFLTALKQIAFWHFNGKGAVLKYDAWIPSLDLFASILHGIDLYSPAGMSGTIEQICGLRAQTCVGNNTVYSSVADCIQTLTAKPFGRLDEHGGTTCVPDGSCVVDEASAGDPLSACWSNRWREVH